MEFQVTGKVLSEALGSVVAAGGVFRWLNTPHRRSHDRMQRQIDQLYQAFIPEYKRTVDPLPDTPK